MLGNAPYILAALNGGDIAGIVIGSIVGVAAVVFLAVAGYLWFSRVKCNKTFKAMHDRFSRIASVLANDINTSLDRLKILGNSNRDYRALYDECLDVVKRISENYEAPAHESLDALNQRLKARDALRGIKGKINECTQDLDAFQIEVNKLRNRIKDILKDDTEYAGRICAVKAKLRDFKQFVSDNEAVLKVVKPVLDFFFNGLDDWFVQFDLDLEKTDYKKAETHFTEINKVVDALDKYGRQLTRIIPLASEVLPEKLKQLYLDYYRIKKENIPLDHLRVEEQLKEMCDDIVKVRNSLQNLDLGHDMEILDSVSHRSDALSQAFQEEKAARDKFVSDSTDYGSRYYDLQEHSLKSRTTLQEREKRYSIDQKQRVFYDSMDDRIEQMAKLKASLDDCIHATIPQPYTLLLKKSQDLKKCMDDFEADLNNLDYYLSELVKTEKNAREQISEIHIGLYRSLAKVREINVQAFNDERFMEAEKIFVLLTDAYKALSEVPMDVNKVSSLLQDAIKAAEVFNTTTNHLVENAVLTQNLLVNLNRYVPEMNNVINSSFGNAMEYFENGEFSNCASICQRLMSDFQQAFGSSLEDAA